MKPAVRRQQWPRYGLLGAEYHWDIYLGLQCVGSMRAWADAVVVANLIHRAISASTPPETGA